jgi:hypothetical protein
MGEEPRYFHGFANLILCTPFILYRDVATTLFGYMGTRYIALWLVFLFVVLLFSHISRGESSFVIKHVN